MPEAVQTVLVTEDDETLRSLLADLLRAERYRVFEARDGEAGLQLSQQLQPNVILPDLSLPRRSGLAVLNTLKDREPTRDIPVLIVSAYALLQMAADACRADGVSRSPSIWPSCWRTLTNWHKGGVYRGHSSGCEARRTRYLGLPNLFARLTRSDGKNRSPNGILGH